MSATRPKKGVLEPKKKPATAPKPRGAPSKYRPEFVEQARRLCMLGLVGVELAKFFEVAESTLYDWCMAHPEFAAALAEGRVHADGVVAQSLFKRANGYEHKAVKIMQYEGSPVVVDYTERYAPDTVACIFWLKNRRPDLWRDRHDHTLAGGAQPVEVIDARATDQRPTTAALQAALLASRQGANDPKS